MKPSLTNMTIPPCGVWWTPVSGYAKVAVRIIMASQIIGVMQGCTMRLYSGSKAGSETLLGLFLVLNTPDIPYRSLFHTLHT